jgi:hypothetical protein
MTLDLRKGKKLQFPQRDVLGVPHPRRAATEPALSEVDSVGYADRGHHFSLNPRPSSPASRDERAL